METIKDYGIPVVLSAIVLFLVIGIAAAILQGNADNNFATRTIAKGVPYTATITNCTIGGTQYWTYIAGIVPDNNLLNAHQETFTYNNVSGGAAIDGNWFRFAEPNTQNVTRVCYNGSMVNQTSMVNFSAAAGTMTANFSFAYSQIIPSFARNASTYSQIGMESVAKQSPTIGIIIAMSIIFAILIGFGGAFLFKRN